MAGIPKITFGIIVLNGEPFTGYNLRALYPFAYQIIIAEGASPLAAHMARPDGHSIDGTLGILRHFKSIEDRENKVTIVTAEDEGYSNGFWPGEKDEQSQAYAKRATGDWLWQVDVDEFYHPEDMQKVCEYLNANPDTTCLTFNAYHFWGGFDYLVKGGLFISRRFQGEPWGAYRRVFKWSPGYQYVTHRPPTVVDSTGQDVTIIKKYNLSRHFRSAPIYMYHYTNLFPDQVIPKGVYHANQGSAVGKTQRRKFESFLTPLDQKKAIRIYDHYGTYNWLCRFSNQHPPAIRELRLRLECGSFNFDKRSVEDIERVLSSKSYRRAIKFLYYIEWLRSQYFRILDSLNFLFRKALESLARQAPSALVHVLPEPWQFKIQRLRSRPL